MFDDLLDHFEFVLSFFASVEHFNDYFFELSASVILVVVFDLLESANKAEPGHVVLKSSQAFVEDSLEFLERSFFLAFEVLKEVVDLGEGVDIYRDLLSYLCVFVIWQHLSEILFKTLGGSVGQVLLLEDELGLLESFERRLYLTR